MASHGRLATTALPTSLSDSTTLSTSGRAAAALVTGPSVNLNEFEMDWSPQARDGQHIWIDAEAKDQMCYSCGDGRSSSRGPRQRCMACKIVVHQTCMPELLIGNVLCRRTFAESFQDSEDGECVSEHHWVKQRKAVGKCPICSKHIITKLLKSSRDFHAIGCSWCKQLFHLGCFMSDPGVARTPCQLGEFRSYVIPRQWIIRLVRARHMARRGPRPGRALRRPFIVRHVGSDVRKPLLVFVNPKSGGNQGAKVLARLLWLLNPRQVFNLLQGGPEFALRLYGKLPRLRILVCGGDGTIGWVLSAIDKLGIKPCPPIAVLPIGTGNDMSRTLGWGGKYTDESLIRILHRLSTAAVVRLDRWDLLCQPGAPAPEVLNEHGEECVQCADKPPLAVFNNYFSIGADALVVLEFHESREANPERFNSRWFNKMFYAGAGGKEILERKSRDFSKYVGVLADGVDLTPKIRQEKLAAIVFLNIPNYSSGTKPWGTGDTEFGEARLDDGLIEVIGLNSMTMAALHLGRPGVRITQAKEVTIITSRALPVQVDGEPCRLAASTLQISFRNQANMLARVKSNSGDPSTMAHSSLTIANLGELVQSLPMTVSHSRSSEGIAGTSASITAMTAAGSAAASHLDDDEAVPAVPATLLNQEDIAVGGGSTSSTSSSTSGGIVNIVAIRDAVRDRYSAKILERAATAPHGLSDDDDDDDDDDLDTFDEYSDDSDSGLSQATSNLLPRNRPDSPLLTRSVFALPEQAVTEATAATAAAATAAAGVSAELDDDQDAAPLSVLRVTSSVDASLQAAANAALATDKPSPLRVLSVPLACQQPRSPALQHRPVQRTVQRSANGELPHRSCMPSAASVESIISVTHAQIDMDHSLVNACKQGNVDVVKRLQELGASLTNFDEQGLMPLHHAVRHNRMDVVAYLLEHLPSARLGVVDMRKRQTALHKAAWYGYRDIAVALIQAGSPLLSRDYEGLTAYQRSLASSNTELQRYLCELEGDRSQNDVEESRL